MPCGSSVHFVPRQYGLSSAVVLVTDLQPDSNYSFTVESQNGVSDLSPSPRGKVVINVTTSQTGESIWQTRTHTHTQTDTHMLPSIHFENVSSFKTQFNKCTVDQLQKRPTTLVESNARLIRENISHKHLTSIKQKPQRLKV